MGFSIEQVLVSYADAAHRTSGALYEFRVKRDTTVTTQNVGTGDGSVTVPMSLPAEGDAETPTVYLYDKPSVMTFATALTSSDDNSRVQVTRTPDSGGNTGYNELAIRISDMYPGETFAFRVRMQSLLPVQAASEPAWTQAVAGYAATGTTSNLTVTRPLVTVPVTTGTLTAHIQHLDGVSNTVVNTVFPVNVLEGGDLLNGDIVLSNLSGRLGFHAFHMASPNRALGAAKLATGTTLAANATKDATIRPPLLAAKTLRTAYVYTTAGTGESFTVSITNDDSSYNAFNAIAGITVTYDGTNTVALTKNAGAHNYTLGSTPRGTLKTYAPTDIVLTVTYTNAATETVIVPMDWDHTTLTTPTVTVPSLQPKETVTLSMLTVYDPDNDVSGYIMDLPTTTVVMTDTPDFNIDVTLSMHVYPDNTLSVSGEANVFDNLDLDHMTVGPVGCVLASVPGGGGTNPTASGSFDAAGTIAQVLGAGYSVMSDVTALATVAVTGYDIANNAVATGSVTLSPWVAATP